MTKLGVNVDHVATIRQARQAPEPDPVGAALLAELAGAHGITVHLRGDRRHIQDSDVRRLREAVTTRLNVEMAATDEMARIAARILPHQATLVPEREGEITTEGGLDVVRHKRIIANSVRRLKKAGIQISLFIDPMPDQVAAAVESGAAMIELNTRAFSETCPLGVDECSPAIQRELGKVRAAAEQGVKGGLRILAGHGLTYRNVHLISQVPEIEELNIGHNIIARAVLVGMDRAVREMLVAMNG
jgi:pyridoxine 5-phosphate synthase